MNRSSVPRAALGLLVVALLVVAGFAIADPPWLGDNGDARAPERALDQSLSDIGLSASAVDDGVVEVHVRTTGSLERRRCDLTTGPGALVEFDAWRQLATFLWGDAPAERSFIALGDPPSGVTPPVRVADTLILLARDCGLEVDGPGQVVTTPPALDEEDG